MGWPKYETLRMTWKDSLNQGRPVSGVYMHAGNQDNLKSFAGYNSRSQVDIGVKPRTEEGRAVRGRCRSAPSLKGYALRTQEDNIASGTIAEQTYARGEELLHNSPYSRELCTRSGRRARHFYPSLHRNAPGSAVPSSPSSPTQLARPARPLSSVQGTAKRNGARTQQKPIRLPSLQGLDQGTGNSFPKRGSPEQQKKTLKYHEAADQQPLLQVAITWPSINPSESMMAQTMGTDHKKSKKAAPPLSKIYSAAQSISKELDRTMSKWQPKEEKKDEVCSPPGTSNRVSINLDVVSSGASILNTQDSSTGNRKSASAGTDASGPLDLADPDQEGLNVERLRGAFLHFVEPGTFDLSIHNLLDLLRYVGHPVISTTSAAVKDLVKEVTTYDYLDYDEFMGFMERYVEYEKKNFHEVFMSFDDDGSGELDVGELRALVKDIGIMLLSGMFQEAVRVVDDGNGQLDFDEFLRFLRIYQCNEGFTTPEVKEINKSMAQLRESENVEKECGNGIPVDLLADLLVRFFGMHTGPDAKELQEEVIKRHLLHNPHSSRNFYLSLQEVLLYGRQLREKYYIDLKSRNKKPTDRYADAEKPSITKPYTRASLVEFQRFDEDGDSRISEGELRNALTTMQYEPLKVVIHEVMNELLPEPFEDGQELGFDEFFDFILVYRQREGFPKSDVTEFKSIFLRYDEDNSGSMDTLELADVFRYMGYSLSVDELKKLILLVDEDRTNELNFREYLQLLRLHRCGEIRKMRAAFKSRMDSETKKLSKSGVIYALGKMGITDPPKEVLKGLSDKLTDFEDFVALSDKCHKIKVNKERKRAGFSDTEMEEILELFRRFDKDGSGDIDCTELQLIFAAFGWAPKTEEEQQDIYGRLDRARALAREAGVEEVSPFGSGFVTKWEYVQLARMIRRQQETADERAEAKLAQDLHFLMPEVNEFRQVFHHWRKVEAGSDDEAEEEDGTKKPDVLSRDTMRRVVRSMGVKFTGASKETFDKQMEVINNEPFIDFHGFLHLMRWILDTDFGGVVSRETDKDTGASSKPNT